jgi:hypothetical protein
VFEKVPIAATGCTKRALHPSPGTVPVDRDAFYARSWSVGMVLLSMLLLPPPAFACIGDCDQDGMTGVNDLVVAVHAALVATSLSSCPTIDVDQSSTVSIDEIVAAVHEALHGCLESTATPTGLSASATCSGTASPTQTKTPAPDCTFSLDRTRIDVYGCPPNSDTLRGAFQVLTDDPKCCWNAQTASGRVLLTPTDGCGPTAIEYEVPQNNHASKQAELIVVSRKSGEFSASLGIFQSRSCTRTATRTVLSTPSSTPLQ